MYHKVPSDPERTHMPRAFTRCTGWGWGGGGLTGCLYGSEDFRTMQTTNLYYANYKPVLTDSCAGLWAVGKGAFIAGVRVCIS